ncbi:MAG: sulfite exporter TauE/SafE family protein [Actinomycetaceae bacterium]|nr:sulfite exporter TauE/SafE family protein [Arcanobacterium sp.]MDD7505281.1 sulfite exporter TauE/SafE family protein [Actinomycetaceae bacterium]MDY6143410.1 sulfite exporter TauE/SafE family protein [Arcanobacterium sp.]
MREQYEWKQKDDAALMDAIVNALVIGLLIGVVVGLLGAGGGILSVPVLVYLLGQEAHNAAAGSLVIVGLTSIVSLVPRLRQGTIKWRDGIIFGLISVVGALLGARISVLVPEVLLMIVFGALLIVVAILMAERGVKDLRAERKRGNTSGRNADEPAENLIGESASTRRGNTAIVLAATCIGLLTGFFGVGGGFAVVPMLVLVLGFTMKEASATSLVVMVISSLSGLIGRIGTDVQIDFHVVLPFAFASMLGGLLGGMLTKRFRDAPLTLTFAALLAVVAAYVLSVNIAALV